MKALFSSIAALLLTTGCASGKDEMAKQLDDLKREVVALRATSSAFQDRLDMLESNAPAAAATEEDADKAASNDRPTLDVVHLTPTDDAPAEDAVAVAPPPIDEGPPIELVGDEKGITQVEAPPAGEVKPKPPWASHAKAPSHAQPPSTPTKAPGQ